MAYTATFVLVMFVSIVSAEGDDQNPDYKEYILDFVGAAAYQLPEPASTLSSFILAAPDLTKGALRVWAYNNLVSTERNLQDAEESGNREDIEYYGNREDRWQAVYACLNGDCSRMRQLEGGSGAQPPGEGSGPSGSAQDELDLLNCLCRCAKPEKSDFECSYSLKPYPTILGGSPSCGDLKNGPCMCQAIGCFRAPLPTSGECYDACRNQYPGVSVVEPNQSEVSTTSDGGISEPASPGEEVTAGSTALILEKEPNDEIGDATEIKFASPVAIKGQITPARDTDYYKFYVNSSGILEIDLTTVPEEMKARVDLYGKDFNWITRKDASNAGDTFTFEKDILGPGWHYIAISDLEGKAHPSDYSFVADFQPTDDPNEPNDVVGDASEVDAGEAVQAYICPASDVDFYRFFAESSGILQVKMSSIPEEMKTRIDLYGKNFNWITRKDASNAGDLITFEPDLQGPAWHYIAITDLNQKAHPSAMEFDLTFKPAPDTGEPNDAVGDAKEIRPEEQIEGYICPVGDLDFYAIFVDSSGILEAKLDDVPSDMRARIDLYGKSYNWITRKDASNAGDAITLEKDVSGPGWHYIAVQDLDRKAHDKSYALITRLKTK